MNTAVASVRSVCTQASTLTPTPLPTQTRAAATLPAPALATVDTFVRGSEGDAALQGAAETPDKREPLADEQPTQLSQVFNSAPRWIKDRMNAAAIEQFKSRNPNFDTTLARVKEQMEAIGDRGLGSFASSIGFPSYYRIPVHIPPDGVNNGLEGAIQAPAAHDGLYTHNTEVRATTYDPALDTIEKLLESQPTVRLAFAGSGFGGDAVDFVARMLEKKPHLMNKVQIDLYDLSPHFLDVGSFEIPYRLQKLGLNAPTYRFLTPPAEVMAAAAQGAIAPNDVQIGYTSNDSIIKNLYLKDISADGFAEDLSRQGIAPYDVVMAMYTFHEMPEGKVRETMANLVKLGKSPKVFVQDMDFEKRVQRLQRAGFGGQLGSLFTSVIFRATEPFSGSPKSSEIPKLLAEYGTIRELAQSETTEKEASIFAFVVDPTGHLPS